MKTSTILKRAKHKIRTPDRWVKNSFQEEINGKECYCALGALESLDVPYNDLDRATEILEKSAPAVTLPINPILAYNDAPERTHKQILKLFDRAIKKAEDNGD